MLKHMEIAQTQLGQREIAGAEHNPQIIEYFTATSYHATEDEVPWCAAFVNWVLFKAGIARTKSAAALSFLDWGLEVKLKHVKYGDVAVINRGGGRGHVGFVIGFNDKKEVGLLGGNQQDEVNVSWFNPADIASFRRAKTLANSKTAAAAAATIVSAGVTAGLTVEAFKQEQVLVNSSEVDTVVSYLPEDWKIPATFIFGIVNLGFIIYERWKRLQKTNV